MEYAHEENYKGVELKIAYDTYPESPREWDNLGTMFCCHSRYNLGDRQFKDGDELRDAMMRDYLKGDDLIAWIRFWDGENDDKDYARVTRGIDPTDYDAKSKAYTEFCRERKESFWDRLDKYAIVLPLYLYDHSGITMSTGRFSCPWDSGQVGWIAVSREKVREEYSAKRISPKLEAKIREYLIGEVKTYDDYLTGQVYGYVLEDEKLKLDDSLWGMYGLEYAIQEAKNNDRSSS